MSEKLDSQTLLPESEATTHDDTVASGRPEMSTQEALERLHAGLPLENVRIRRLKLRGTFEKPVVIRNCHLVQPEFNGATFAEPAAIVKCSVEKLKTQKPACFEKGLDIGGSTFRQLCLGRVTVKGKLTATHTQFAGKISFVKCVFADQVKFWESHFQCWVDFKECRFEGEADFRSLHSEQGMVFSKCHFLRDFLLRGATIQKKVQLDQSTFDAMLDLSKAKLFDFVYLEEIHQGPDMRWAFLNAVADRVLVRPEQVEGRLASEQTGRHDDAMQEYGLLKRSYQSLHRFDAEDWAFYRFKVNQRLSKPTTWRRPWTVWRTLADWLFLDIGSGYGTKPGRAVRMAFLIIMGFATLYAAYADMFHVETIPFAGEQTTLANRIMIGLTTSVAVFTSGMGGIRDIAHGWMNVPVMVESVMGTLLFGLFIVAFSRKVIR